MDSSPEEMAQRVKAHIDGRFNELDHRLSDVEQKASRPRGETKAATWGGEFVEKKAADIASLAENRGRVSMSIKSTLTSAADSAGALVVPQRDQLVGMPKRRLTIRDLLTVINVDSGSVEYPRQTGRTLNANVVAEGDAKPESGLAFELKQVPMRVIAHWMPASRQILDDAPQLASTIDQELRYGLGLREEAQLLYGDGTNQNLAGMVPLASAFASPITLTSPTMLDTIGAAILQASLTDTAVDGIIHPSDWWRMRLLKNADGEYLLGDPQANVTPSLFGLPVVPTQAMTVDKFLVGNFAEQSLYDRWQARVEVSTEHADFFVRNLVAILAEERIGFAAKQPQGLIYGDFGNVP